MNPANVATVSFTPCHFPYCACRLHRQFLSNCTCRRCSECEGDWASSSRLKMNLLTLTILIISKICLAHYSGMYPVIMPRVFPAVEEVYLCTMVDLSQHNTAWIRGFHPKVNSEVVHHALLAGCSERPPPTKFNLWNCGGDEHVDPAYPSNPVCPPERGGGVSGSFAKDTTIYLWAANGKPLMMPRGVGFQIGGSSRVKGCSTLAN